MSGDRRRGSDVIPSSPFDGLRSRLLSSPLRLQLLVVVTVLIGTIGVATGVLVLFGVIPADEPTTTGPAPTPTATPTPTPTATPTPTPTATPTARDVVGDYRAATVVGTTTGGYVALQFPDGDVRQLPLAAVSVPGAGGADPAPFDGVIRGAAGRACLGTYGSRATVAMAAALDGERVGVRVVRDRTAPGGVGVYLRSGGEVVNRDLVRRGFARATTDEYREEMVDARDGEQGLWECGTVEPTAVDHDVATVVEVSPAHAADEGGLRVVEVRPNPPSGASLAAETLTLRNTGSTTVDLDGWLVGDDDGTRWTLSRFTTAENRRLQPGERLVVHTGGGRPRDGHYYLGASQQLWDDDGDVVRVAAPTVGSRGGSTYRRSVTVWYGRAALERTEDTADS